MTEFNASYLRARSCCGESVDDLYHGEYDLVVVSSSWDRRSVAIVDSTHLKGYCGVFYDFAERDDRGLRDEHDRCLRAFLAKTCRTTKEIKGESGDVEQLWSNTFELLVSVYREVGHSLRVFIDLSACPRFYSLGILAAGITSGIVHEVSFGYAEGVYPDELSEDHRHEMFTRGGWRAEPIPSLDGEWDPAEELVYLVSVGFEGSKTLRLVSREEPDHMAVLFPEPPVREGYEQRTYDNNKALFRLQGIKDDDLIKAHAADAVAAWQALREKVPETLLSKNCMSLCCGSKPHSLGLALHALTMPRIAVLYIVPDKHKVVDVKPNGVYWRFDVVDSSAITRVRAVKP